MNTLDKIKKFFTKKSESETMIGFVRNSICPDCKDSGTLLEGPHAGLAMNIMCSKCKSRFNITPFSIDRI